MSTPELSRREFLELNAVAAGASLLGDPMSPHALSRRTRVAASDRVRFGIIGVGMQGSGLLRTAVRLPGIECVAAADLYDGRHRLAREIAGEKIRTTRRYQELLDAKDIDCIIAAVPDHWHRKVVVDATSAGKDIYCEKPMSHSAADGVAMVDAQKKTGRVIQIGSQRVSSRVIVKARELIANGLLGDITMVEGSQGRNDPTGAWQYPPPPDLSPSTMDWDTWQGDVPKRPFDANLFARWRCWKEYGTGVAGDLMVHLVSGMMYALSINEAPRQAMAIGGIRRWKDGRNMPDVHAALFYYGDLPVYMRLNLGTETPEGYRIQGSKGLLEISGDNFTFTPQTGTDQGPSYYTGGYPRDMREAYVKQWHEQNDERVRREALQQPLTFHGPDFDDLAAHQTTFFDAVRTRKPVPEDAVFGHHAALACHMANEAYFRQGVVRWDEAAQRIVG